MWGLLRELEGIDEEEIILLIEIIKILKKHGKVKEDKKEHLSAVAESPVKYEK